MEGLILPHMMIGLSFDIFHMTLGTVLIFSIHGAPANPLVHANTVSVLPVERGRERKGLITSQECSWSCAVQVHVWVCGVLITLTAWPGHKTTSALHPGTVDTHRYPTQYWPIGFSWWYLLYGCVLSSAGETYMYTTCTLYTCTYVPLTCDEP